MAEEHSGWLDNKNTVHTSDAQARLFRKDRLAMRLKKLDADLAKAEEDQTALSKKQQAKLQRENDKRDARLRRQSPSPLSDREKGSSWEY